MTLPTALWTAFAVMLVLKLAGVIAWSWWIVTAPLWGPLLALGLFGVVLAVLVVGAEAISRRCR